MALRNIKNFNEIKLDGDLTPNSLTAQMLFQRVLNDPGAIPGGRLDNVSVQNAGLFLLRQLQYVRSSVREVKYPENKCLSFLPPATDIPASVSQYVYYLTDRTGKSRMQNGNAKGPLPRVEVNNAERYGKVVSLEACYGWTIDELREASRLMMDLPTRKSEAARKVILADTDEVLRTGQLTFDNGEPAQVASGIGGFCNHAEIAISGVALTSTRIDGTTFSATYGSAMHDWFVAATTADQMANDLFGLEQAIKSATKGIDIPDTLLMATPLLTVLTQTKMSLASDKNVLQYYLDNSRYIKNIEEWIYLDNAGGTDSGTGAASNKHRMVMYKRDADCIEAVNPLEFEQLAAQLEGFEFTIPCRGKVGGVKVYRPRSALYADVSTKTS